MGDLPTDRELLAELSTFDEVVTWVPGSVDHDTNTVPVGTELAMSIKRGSMAAPRQFGKRSKLSPVNVAIPMTRHDGEYLIEALHTALHPDSGGTITGTLWLELDAVVNRIMKRVNKGKAPKPTDVGEARGLATAIAILANPYAYDVDAVKDESMARYDARNP